MLLSLSLFYSVNPWLCYVHTHVIKSGFMGLQTCKCDSVYIAGSQVASREAACRLDRLRGMLFLCEGRPLTLCSKTCLRGCCCTGHSPEAESIGITGSKQIVQIYG